MVHNLKHHTITACDIELEVAGCRHGGKPCVRRAASQWTESVSKLSWGSYGS